MFKGISFTILVLGLLVNQLSAQTWTIQYNTPMGRNTNSYYEYLPQGYNPSGTETYPLIINVHGLGDLGTGTPSSMPLIIRAGLPKLINDGLFPNSFTSNGQTFKFIVISPQYIYWPAPPDVNDVINYTISHYKVDITRIYLTGLSMGGGTTWEYIGNQAFYANRIAAAVPVCGLSAPNNTSARIIANADVPVWATHNNNDPAVPVSYTNDWVSMINAAPSPSPLAKKSIFNNNIHDAWTKTYDPNFKENNLNIYEWMLLYTRSGAAPGNQSPIANPGSTQTIALPITTASLTGSGFDPDGTITSYAWTQVSGTAATIQSPTSQSTNITGLTTVGTRVFRLTVTDNQGATGSNTVSVVVNPTAANMPPVPNAGADQSISLPATSAILNGSAVDNDGVVNSHTWSFVSGPVTASIVSPDSYTTSITGLTATGTYVFRLSATDNLNATGSDDVSVIVYPVTSGTKTINVNVYGTAIYNDAAWNNWQTTNSLTSAAFKYSDGTSSPINAVLSAQTSYADNGPNYPVTMCPQQVGRDASHYTATRTTTINGLDNNKLYDLKLYASRGNVGQTTRFTINSTSVDIATNQNYTNAAVFNNITPTAGKIVVTLAALSTYNYLNGFTLTERTVSNNQFPVANAGQNQTISLPATTTSLIGAGIDGDGTIASYAWTQVGGTAANIATPDQSTTDITGLTTTGVRIFRLTVTDNQGATGSSDVTVTVNPASSNQPPTANAGTDQNTTSTSVNLTGSGTDPEGGVVTYAWTRFSGPNTPNIVSPASASTSVTGLIPGTYVFRLTVTDGPGLSATSDVTIIVSAVENTVSPVVTTNAPQSIGTTTVSLTSNASGPAAINTTKWTKFSVPGQTVKSITVIGSSTSAGTGASVPDSAYVNRLKAYYKAQGIIDTIYNLAVGGTWPMDADITAALNKGAPVLLVNYPSNNYSASNLAASIARFQEIKDSCDARGVLFYCTGTQPRDNYDAPGRANLVVLNDSLRNRFGDRFIDFMTPMLNTADNTIKPAYAAGDGVHINDLGHGKFFEIVKATNIFQNLNTSASVISTPNTANTQITGLTPGIHQFQVSVIDARGLAASTVAKVTVSGANQPPTANAGTNKIISLPTTTTSLTGSGTDPEGGALTYAWTQTNGIAATIQSPSSSSTNITGLTTTGLRTFRLTVTDNGGLTATSDVTVTVNAANQPPTL